MSEVTSVVRSMVENVSSPTLLMRDVMRSVRDVVGRDVAVVAALAVPAIAEGDANLSQAKLVHNPRPRRLASAGGLRLGRPTFPGTCLVREDGRVFWRPHRGSSV